MTRDARVRVEGSTLRIGPVESGVDRTEEAIITAKNDLWNSCEGKQLCAWFISLDMSYSQRDFNRIKSENSWRFTS